jgi:flagellar motor switch protein FliM
MLKPLITQDELDTLLASIQVAEARQRGRPHGATAALYDFRHASRLSPDQMRALRHRLLALATVLTPTLTAYLGQPAAMTLHSVDLASHEQYLRNLPSHPVLGVVTFGQGASQVLWEMSPSLAHVALDSMLGGSGSPGPDAASDMGPLGRAVLARLFHEILSAWSELWAPLRAVNARVEGVICSPAAGDTRPGTEWLLNVVMGATIAQQRGVLRLCLPLSIVRQLLREEKASRGSVAVPMALPKTPADGPLIETPMRVSVRLEGAEVALSALLRLRPGDVLDLRVPAATPFTVRVGARPRFRAIAGVSSGKVAAKLTDELAAG